MCDWNFLLDNNNIYCDIMENMMKIKTTVTLLQSILIWLPAAAAA